MEKLDRTDLLIKKYSFYPSVDDLIDIRKLLNDEIINEKTEENEYLRTLCILLFILGNVEDSLLIWKAKRKNFDAGCYIDVEFLFGAGYEKTVDYFKKINNKESKKILKYIKNNYVVFNKENKILECKDYFGIDR